MGGARVDLLVRDGRIAALGAGVAAPPGVESIDGGGALLLPGLVEAHTHLDKTSSAWAGTATTSARD
jgi:cytosine/adenosine deaminase-related metal-dependent hydrolase